MAYSGFLATEPLFEVDKDADPDNGSWVIPIDRADEFPDEVFLTEEALDGSTEARALRGGRLRVPAVRSRSPAVRELLHAGGAHRVHGAPRARRALRREPGDARRRHPQADRVRAGAWIGCVPHRGNHAARRALLEGRAGRVRRRRSTPTATSSNCNGRRRTSPSTRRTASISTDRGRARRGQPLARTACTPASRHLGSGHASAAATASSAPAARPTRPSRSRRRRGPARTPRRPTDKPITEVPLGNRSGIHHFLVPGQGWGAACDAKEIKELEPEWADAVNAWRKTIHATPEPAPARTPATASPSGSRSSGLTLRARSTRSGQATRQHIDVWGAETPAAGARFGEAAIRKVLDDPQSATFRLRTLMDAWCSLWLWAPQTRNGAPFAGPVAIGRRGADPHR